MQPSDTAGKSPSALQSGPSVAAGPRLFFVDNLRVFLTVLVILHHLMITYAGTGSWYYNEGREDIVTIGLGGWFCSTNQAYFMGLFLLISAYFIPGSYDRKGPWRFFKDRLIRLGIPLAVYSWIINPLFVYVLFGVDMPFWDYFPGEYFRHGWIGQGPLWFVEVLLILSLAYVVWRLLVKAVPASSQVRTPFPGIATAAVFALLLGLASFLVRIVFVIDEYTFEPLNLQLPFFVQYIALFVIGLVAFRRDWLLGLPDRIGRFWLMAAVVLFLLWPPMMLANGAADGDTAFKGGLTWESFLFAMWESFMCVAMCIGLVYFFRRRLNRRGSVAGFLVPNAYTAYIIHAPVITFAAAAVGFVALYPLLKWAALAIVVVPLCFGLSALIRKLPYTDRVL